MKTSNAVPAPDYDQPYWEAAAQGKLALPYCLACRRVHLYPRRLCPFCHARKFEWRGASGAATVYSFTVIPSKDAGEAPMVLAIVVLAEGPHMLASIVDCAPNALRVEQSVCLSRTAEAQGRWLFCFSPVQEKAS